MENKEALYLLTNNLVDGTIIVSSALKKKGDISYV